MKTFTLKSVCRVLPSASLCHSSSPGELRGLGRGDALTPAPRCVFAPSWHSACSGGGLGVSRPRAPVLGCWAVSRGSCRARRASAAPSPGHALGQCLGAVWDPRWAQAPHPWSRWVLGWCPQAVPQPCGGSVIAALLWPQRNPSLLQGSQQVPNIEI